MPDPTDWTCGKPGCELSVDEHSFGLAISHIFEMDETEGDEAAERILTRAEKGLLGGTNG